MITAMSLLPPPPPPATMNPQENVNLYTGNRLVIDSNQPSIKSVVVRGNLTAATLSNNAYPSKNFTLTTNSTQLYTIDLLLSYQAPYTSEIVISDPSSGSKTQYTSYFVAGFAISLAVMIGEVLVLLIAQYLFFVNLDLVSLIDFFSIFFVAALGTLVYLTREGLERIFDLKPIMED